MSAGDFQEFISLCAAILDDGEVSSDEAYQLAEWLNTHREVALAWPAKELVKPRQQIWAAALLISANCIALLDC